MNDLTAFIGEGAEGALIGGVIGGIASLFLPGGIILTAVGAIVGAAIQQILEQTASERADELRRTRESLEGTWLAEAAEVWTAWGRDVGDRWENFWRGMGWR